MKQYPINKNELTLSYLLAQNAKNAKKNINNKINKKQNSHYKTNTPSLTVTLEKLK